MMTKADEKTVTGEQEDCFEDRLSEDSALCSDTSVSDSESSTAEMLPTTSSLTTGRRVSARREIRRQKGVLATVKSEEALDNNNNNAEKNRRRRRSRRRRNAAVKVKRSFSDASDFDNSSNSSTSNADDDSKAWNKSNTTTYPAARPKSSDGEHRVLMRQWLIQMTDMSAFRGMRWHDSQRTMIRIPWKHGSRTGWTVHDCEVFKAWAHHTGRDHNEPKRWKANFRCALNSLGDVTQRKDLAVKRGPDTYVVYELKPQKQRRQNVASACRKIKCEPDTPTEATLTDRLHHSCNTETGSCSTRRREQQTIKREAGAKGRKSVPSLFASDAQPTTSVNWLHSTSLSSPPPSSSSSSSLSINSPVSSPSTAYPSTSSPSSYFPSLSPFSQFRITTPTGVSYGPGSLLNLESVSLDNVSFLQEVMLTQQSVDTAKVENVSLWPAGLTCNQTLGRMKQEVHKSSVIPTMVLAMNSDDDDDELFVSNEEAPQSYQTFNSVANVGSPHSVSESQSSGYGEDMTVEDMNFDDIPDLASLSPEELVITEEITDWYSNEQLETTWGLFPDLGAFIQ